ncbi:MULTISPECIES: hypothetical protein [unclassified Spirosoma]|uniref:hypothetical protein n=1 Tax=unclassified Spirosoma TaxID=2621999 RepID=UPI00095B7ADB|nr:MULTISPECIES: hypothetical protein [unclassified Spirosoma]MBN8821869.1 hypothetical protein [Spirosoma sp.]OJW80646.1 MAG: hypothetical protein BGO59_34840 [Spirosoma sp. 48-14]
MESLDEIVHNTEQRAAAIARLLKLIEMDTAIIRRHQDAHDESIYTQQYIELRARNLMTLTQLLEADGLLKANLQLGNRAA